MSAIGPQSPGRPIMCKDDRWSTMKRLFITNKNPGDFKRRHTFGLKICTLEFTENIIQNGGRCKQEKKLKRRAKSKVFFVKMLLFYIRTSKYGIFYIFLTYHEIIDFLKTWTTDSDHHFHRRTSRRSSNRPLTTNHWKKHVQTIANW